MNCNTTKRTYFLACQMSDDHLMGDGNTMLTSDELISKFHQKSKFEDPLYLGFQDSNVTFNLDKKVEALEDELLSGNISEEEFAKALKQICDCAEEDLQ